jgi:hypothetical protein
VDIQLTMRTNPNRCGLYVALIRTRGLTRLITLWSCDALAELPDIKREEEERKLHEEPGSSLIN